MSIDFLRSHVTGHEQQKEQLSVALEKGSLPHALLFTGPAGIGKRRLARAVAALVLSNEESQLPTETARTQTMLGTHPDLHLVAKTSSQKDLSVEAIRDLTHQLQLKPYIAKKTVGIIDDAHTMSIAAANSLLMTLEEPNANVHLILISDAYHKLPPTIVSRCQIVHFADLSAADTRMVLQEQLKSFPDIDIGALHNIARHNLAPLQLAPFVEEKTLVVTDSEESRAHLDNVVSLTKSLSTRLDEIFARDANDAPIAAIMAVASEYADKQRSPFFWSLLRGALREKLTRSADVTRWANALEHSLEAERLVVERNASPQIQLSTSLLSAFSVR